MTPERLKALRTKLGINQTDMARALRVDQARVSSFETGRREPPPHTMLLYHIYRKHPDIARKVLDGKLGKT